MLLDPLILFLDDKPKNPNMPTEEARDLLRTSHQLENDISRLVWALSGSTGDINTLWRVIETVGLIGRFMGEHPHQRDSRTTKGRGVISAKVLRRREIITPLVLAEAKHKRKGIPERAFVKAKKLLIAKGLVEKGRRKG